MESHTPPDVAQSLEQNRSENHQIPFDATQPIEAKGRGLDDLNHFAELDPKEVGWSNMTDYLIHSSHIVSQPDDPTESLSESQRLVSMSSQPLPGMYIAHELLNFPKNGSIRSQLIRAIGPDKARAYFQEVEEYRRKIESITGILRSRGVL